MPVNAEIKLTFKKYIPDVMILNLYSLTFE